MLRQVNFMAIIVAATLFSPSANADCEATAGHCNLGSCDSTECQFNCPTSSDYLIFGEVQVFNEMWGSVGYGVCIFDGSYSSADFTDYCAKSISGFGTDWWTLRADGASGVSGGDDHIRYAVKATCETCGTNDDGYQVRICGNLPSGDKYLFWGDKGNDTIMLCSQSSGTSTYCITNYGRIDGRDGNDTIYGSYHGDYLWGGAGDDYIYGYDGIDYIYGGDGADWLYGHSGDDYIYGEAGVDHLYGFDGDDYLSGGNGSDYIEGDAGCDDIDGDEPGVSGNTDYCWCNDTSDTDTYSAITNCEYAYYCSACFGK